MALSLSHAAGAVRHEKVSLHSGQGRDYQVAAIREPLPASTAVASTKAGERPGRRPTGYCIARALNCVNVLLKAGAVRELYWHKPDEWGFLIRDRMRITGVDDQGHAFLDDMAEGDIWNFPAASPVRSTGWKAKD